MKTSKKETKKAVMKLGCSGALFSALNKEFGHPMETEERASILLCGGLVQTGHQCGMLWGSTMAAGAESYRRNKDKDKAIGMAITISQHLMKSYLKRTGSHNCLEVTGCDFTRPLGLAKYFLLFKTFACTKLAGNWAPEAVQSASEGLASNNTSFPQKCKSCASEVAKKMGASDEEMVLVAGFAGGIGLSGNACGALGAAIYMKTLKWFRDHPGKSPPYFNNPDAKETLRVFREETNSEMLCQKITGKRFDTLDEHTEFVNGGGCAKLIDALAQA